LHPKGEAKAQQDDFILSLKIRIGDGGQAAKRPVDRHL
jgi:hypothetical protein